MFKYRSTKHISAKKKEKQNFQVYSIVKLQEET